MVETISGRPPTQERKKKDEGLSPRVQETVLVIVQPAADLQHPLYPHRVSISRELLGPELTGKSVGAQSALISKRNAKLHEDQELAATRLERAANDLEYQNSPEIQDMMNRIHLVEGLENCTPAQAAKLVRRNLFQRSYGHGTNEDDLEVYAAILRETSARKITPASKEPPQPAVLPATTPAKKPIKIVLPTDKDGFRARTKRYEAFGYQPPENPNVVTLTLRDCQVLIAHYLFNQQQDDFAYPDDLELAKLLGFYALDHLQAFRETLEEPLSRIRTSVLDADARYFLMWLDEKPEYKDKGPEVLIPALYRTISFSELKENNKTSSLVR